MSMLLKLEEKYKYHVWPTVKEPAVKNILQMSTWYIAIKALEKTFRCFDMSISLKIRILLSIIFPCDILWRQKLDFEEDGKNIDLQALRFYILCSMF